MIVFNRLRNIRSYRKYWLFEVQSIVRRGFLPLRLATSVHGKTTSIHEKNGVSLVAESPQEADTVSKIFFIYILRTY